MILQGVIILRITDLIRFFDLAEFWQFKEDFAELLSRDKYGCFFDAEEQKELATVVTRWLRGEDPLATVTRDKLIINVKGADSSFPLGRLSAHVQSCRSKKTPTEKQLTGLTALYVMLGANLDGSDIPIQYELGSSMITGSGGLRPLFADCSLDSAGATSPTSYERSLIVNMNTPQSNKKIHVQCGNANYELYPMDCIIGLFTADNKCVRLFPRSSRDFDGHTCSLVYNPSTKQPSLKIEKVEGVENIENVCCFYMEKGGNLVYLTQDGQFHYDETKCYRLHVSYTTFRRHRPDAAILAFDVSSTGNYNFYTDCGIIR